MAYVEAGGLQIDEALHRFVEEEALPGTGIDAKALWRSLGELIRRFGPRNATLIEKRERLQEAIDVWERQHRGQERDSAAYRSFLTNIGYLVEDVPPFAIETRNTDDEIGRLAGPQLVVPVTNARYALNAANARWGSLYDALYGTDVDSGQAGRKRL